MFTNELNCLKTDRKRIQNEDWPDRSTIASAPIIMDSVNELILTDRGLQYKARMNSGSGAKTMQVLILDEQMCKYDKCISTTLAFFFLA